jgi:acetyltransferase-like isoleucine patch superfamily enzyme
MVRKLIKKIGYKLIKFIVPEIKILRSNLNWNYIEYSVSDNLIGKTVNISSPAHINGVSIDDYSYISINSWISHTQIGKFCSIGPNFLCGWGIHPTNGISTSPMFYSKMKQNGVSLTDENKIEERKKIIIGNDVFIGANVTILDGVTIGDGAVIGAGAIVSKDIPPYAIAIGCPIRIVKYRFEPEQIDKLLKIKWWEFDVEKLKDVEKMFFEVNEFVEKYKI